MAINIFGIYAGLYANILKLQQEEKTAVQSEATAKQSMNNEIALLRVQTDDAVKAIDEEIAQMDIYIDGALSHGATPGYIPVPMRSDPITLQRLYVMLDDNYSQTAEAQSLYQNALNTKEYFCQERAKKEKEFEQKKRSVLSKSAADTKTKNRIDQINSEYEQMARGSKAKAMCAEIVRRTRLFNIRSNKIYQLSECRETSDVFCLGYVLEPYPLKDFCTPYLRQTFGPYYREQDRALLLPVCIRSDGTKKDGSYFAPVITIRYDEFKAVSVSSIMTGLLFNILRNYTPLRHRVVCVDLDTFNSEQIGVMKAFTGENGMIDYPMNTAQALTSLQKLEQTAQQESVRKRRYLFVRGIQSLSDKDLGGCIKKIRNNASLYNIAVILINPVNTSYSGPDSDGFKPTIEIHAEKGQFYTSLINNTKAKFAFNSAPGGISQDSVQRLNALYTPAPLDNRYERFVDLSKPVPYITAPRRRSKITVPYGVIEPNNTLAQITYDNKMWFASFLMGGSGSGKTTMIHALIAGIISNYHPDDVELWLADFKQSGFAPYNTEHMPPHIRYILMDTSYEMIYDFIDRMVEELNDREARLSMLKLDDQGDLPVDQYMPTILVIIDEFSAVSEAASQNEGIKHKLDRLLSKGRNVGFRFLFASQAFTTGAAALSSFAKAQINSRIAMKNVVLGEIKETLSIPSTQMTEQIKLMIDTLPPFYALYKQEKDGLCTVTRSKVLYFKSNDTDGFKSRNAQYDFIKASMKRVELSELDASHPEQYVNKHPIAIHSDVLLKFDKEGFCEAVNNCLADDSLALSEEDTIVTFGQARRLNPNSYAFISRSKRENIFLLSNKEENACTVSLLFSVARSYLLQHKKVKVWCHPKNPLYHSYRKMISEKLTVLEGAEAVCDDIARLLDLVKSKQHTDEIIIVLGAEKLMADLEDGFDYNPPDELEPFDISKVFEIEVPIPATPKDDLLKHIAQTPEDQEAGGYCNELQVLITQKQQEFRESAMASGLYDDAIKKKEKEIESQILEDYYKNKHGNNPIPDTPAEDSQEPQLTPEPEKPSEPEPEKPSEPEPEKPRDFASEFLSLIQQGSLYGCHFMLVLNDFNQLKDIHLKIELFNHRLSFRTDSSETSISIINSSRAKSLAPHVCMYVAQGASSESFLITPYQYKGLSWK